MILKDYYNKYGILSFSDVTRTLQVYKYLELICFCVKMCSPKRHFEALTHDTCECDLVGNSVCVDVIKLR